ncbi:hypothetical protein [Pseudomonas sp. LB3P31]
MSDKLEAPKVEWIEKIYSLTFPKSIGEVTKKGYHIHAWFKGTNTSRVAFGTLPVTYDGEGGGVEFKVERKDIILKGKTVIFLYTIDDLDSLAKYRSEEVMLPLV